MAIGFSLSIGKALGNLCSRELEGSVRNTSRLFSLKGWMETLSLSMDVDV